MSDLRVVTFNVRTGRGLDGRNSWLLRRAAVVDVIRSMDPDVAGLQEVRAGQLRYLLSHLPEYGFLSAGRANGQNRGEHCPVLYRRERFAVVRWEVRWFAANRSGRIATVARLDDRSAGASESITVANTHLDHRFAAVRATSGAALAGWARDEEGPWVVLGDFNATVVDAAVVPLLEAGLQDALAALLPRGASVATAHRFTGRVDGRRIDHVLVSPELEVVHAEIVRTRPGGRLPSDHWPVAALLRRRD